MVERKKIEGGGKSDEEREEG